MNSKLLVWIDFRISIKPSHKYYWDDRWVVVRRSQIVSCPTTHYLCSNIPLQSFNSVGRVRTSLSQRSDK